MKKTTKPATGAATRYGTKDFTDLMFAGSPSWYIFAVEAPIDAVLDEFIRLRKAKEVFRDVPVLRARKQEDVGALIPVVQVPGNPWAVVLRAPGYVNSNHLAEYRVDAGTLSKRLKTRAIAFCGEDTSGSAGYQLYDSGKLIESAEWANGDDSCSEFTSKRRKLPEREVFDETFADEVFSELGIYVPVCFGTKGSKPNLVVEKASTGMVERAHLIDLESWG
jgi:hypothetical protein